MGSTIVVYSGSDELVPLKLTSSQLNSYTKAVLGQDYYFVDSNGDGFADVTAAIPGIFGGSILILGVSLDIQVTIPVAVSETYQYDALGRLTRLYADGQIKTDYCYDNVGNRTAVTKEEECDNDQPMRPPGSISVLTHSGAGYIVSWGAVQGVNYYRLKFSESSPIVINNPTQTAYSTGSNTLANEPVWIQACDEFSCSAKAYF